MASYKITSDISTLGEQGATITDADLNAAGVDAELLILSNVIEPITTKTPTTKEQ